MGLPDNSQTKQLSDTAVGHVMKHSVFQTNINTQGLFANCGLSYPPSTQFYFERRGNPSRLNRLSAALQSLSRFHMA